MFTSYAWECALALLHKLGPQQEFVWKLLLFHTEMISALNFFGEFFESGLYIKCGSMPLTNMAK